MGDSNRYKSIDYSEKQKDYSEPISRGGSKAKLSPHQYIEASENRSVNSHTRSLSIAEESMSLKNLINQDTEASTKNIKTVINYEKKI